MTNVANVEIFKIVRLWLVLNLTNKKALKALFKRRKSASGYHYSLLESRVEVKAGGDIKHTLLTMVVNNFGEKWIKVFNLIKLRSFPPEYVDLPRVTGVNRQKEIYHVLGEITQEQLDEIPEKQKARLVMLTPENIEGLRSDQLTFWPEEERFLYESLLGLTPVTTPS